MKRYTKPSTSSERRFIDSRKSEFKIWDSNVRPRLFLGLTLFEWFVLSLFVAVVGTGAVLTAL